ncbi:MAG: hypothetical protein CBD27_01975 [Rhodospirillaceae bacterium TMED167]|nr:hypothetical protein [Rhodospirillaceae bacterium]OUW30259.1 MAG: hypothetical protein CBD27_01975 [Rhodospirillaceae bacterium TMED167]
MALAHKIGLTGLSPVNRTSAFGRVASSDGMPVEELAEKPSVVYDGATFYYEDLLDGKGQTWSGPQKELTPRAPERKINRSLIVGTTQSFADAFSLVIASDSIESKGSFIGAPSAPTATGIATYAAIARVIYDEIMPPGETLNLNA